MRQDPPAGEPRAFAGEFADLRLVKSRSVVQMVVELPIERFAALVAHFGPPGTSTWVALARLNAPPEPDSAPENNASRPDAPDEGRQAITASVLRCKEPPFQRWLLGAAFRPGDPAHNELGAARQLRLVLGIGSRSELRDPEKLAEWRALCRRFEYETRTGENP